MPLEYTCSHCKEECVSEWDDSEAITEAKENFGDSVMDKPYDIVCDECYNQFMEICIKMQPRLFK